MKIDYSPIKGSAGNIEYLAYMRKNNEYEEEELFVLRKNIDKIVEKAHIELKN